MTLSSDSDFSAGPSFSLGVKLSLLHAARAAASSAASSDRFSDGIIVIRVSGNRPVQGLECRAMARDGIAVQCNPGTTGRPRLSMGSGRGAVSGWDSEGL